MYRILAKDIAPFCLFAPLVIGAFEVSIYFFAWETDTDFVPGKFFGLFTGLGAWCIEPLYA